jgi:hypothetical protein
MRRPFAVAAGGLNVRPYEQMDWPMQEAMQHARIHVRGRLVTVVDVAAWCGCQC